MSRHWAELASWMPPTLKFHCLVLAAIAFAGTTTWSIAHSGGGPVEASVRAGGGPGRAQASGSRPARPVVRDETPGPDGLSEPTESGVHSDSILVVSARENALVLKDPESGERTAFFRVGTSPNAVAVSKDGRTAVVTNRGERISGTTICVVDLYATNLVRTIPLEVQTKNTDRSVTTRFYHRPSGVTFVNGEGGRHGGQSRVLVSCAIEGALLLVDLVEARVIGHCELEAADSHDVAVDHSGQFAYVANHGSGTVSVVQLDRMRLVRSIEAGGGPRGIALHPKKDEIWVTNAATNSISIIDLKERNESMEFACGAMPVDICFSTDGESAYVVNMQEGNVSVIETDSLRVDKVIELERVTDTQARLRPVEMPGHFGKSPLPTRVLINPEGTRAWIATRRDDRIHEVDLDTYDVIRTVSAPTAPDDLGWSRVQSHPAPLKR